MFNALGKLHERYLDGVDLLHQTISKELSFLKDEVSMMKQASFENNYKSTKRQIIVSVVMALIGFIYAMLNIFIIKCSTT